jgi:CubicO group peptidase (beta-lactamase class C family)
MNRFLAFFIFIAIFTQFQSCSSAPGRQQTVDLDDIIAKFDQQFDEEVGRTIPGAAILFVRNGEIYYRGAFGYRDIETHTRMTTDTVFRIASISKSIAALGAMKLVEDGLIGLDVSLRPFIDPNDISRTVSGRIIPDSVWGGPMVLTPIINPETVTFRQLLSHTTGGSFLYNNSGYVLLQIMMEEITGQRFDEFMRVNVFEPLNMQGSSFDWNDPALEARIAKGYAVRADGSLREDVMFPRTMENMARGSMSSTIGDLAIVITEMMKAYNGEENNFILSRDSILLITKPEASIGSGTSVELNMGLGFFARKNLANERLTLYHTGGFAGWTSLYEISLDTRDGFVALANGGRGIELIVPIRDEWYIYLDGK